MTGTGVLLSPRWPRRRTTYERALDELREQERRPAGEIEDDDLGGALAD